MRVDVGTVVAQEPQESAGGRFTFCGYDCGYIQATVWVPSVPTIGRFGYGTIESVLGHDEARLF